MSFSDDEDRKAASSPTFVSRFTDQAKELTTQLPNVARSGAAALDRNMTEFGSVASGLMASVISQAEQLPDAARSRTATLDRNMSGVRSAASDFVTSVISQAGQLPDVARSRGAALDRNMAGVQSAASDFATSVMSKAAAFPGQRFGVSSFSPSSGPERASSKIGQAGNSHGTVLPGMVEACLHERHSTFNALCCNRTSELRFAWHGCLHSPLKCSCFSKALQLLMLSRTHAAGFTLLEAHICAMPAALAADGHSI